MNFRQLHVFVKTAETKNMTEAAKTLYMTQPAVSQTILELEEDLNVKLFERLKRRLYLTDAGESFYSYAKKILALVNESKVTMQHFQNMQLGELKIGASTTIGTYLLPKLAASFRAKHKNINLHYTINNTRIVEELILNHELDVGIVEGVVHSKEIVTEHMMNDELYLICSPNHSWAMKTDKVIKSAEFQQEAIIAREKGSGTQEIVEEVFTRHNITYDITHVLNNTEAIKKAVEANLGISIISRLAVLEELHYGSLVHVKLEDVDFPRNFTIIYHKDKYLSPLFKTFLHYCKSYCSS
ncbi:selenium metabolism-associated LysR family transcriptional regulator [Bacillus tianshenii]|nr:selenium metabolism-associated LysR family transcriptional regulator [Bacillus tianshenii]